MALLEPQVAADGSLCWLPVEGRPEQLMILMHGVGGEARAMTPLARALRLEFPQAALVALQGFSHFEGAPPDTPGRQYFSIVGVTDDNRPERVAAILPTLQRKVHEWQQATGVGPAATALAGFSQGAICALELVQRHDGIAGRVLAFSGRYARLPMQAPRETTLHIFHGGADPVIPPLHARAIIERMAAIGGDATVDIAEGIGHELPPALMRCAIERLRTHIPHRTWQAAMGAVPQRARREGEGDDGEDEVND